MKNDDDEMLDEYDFSNGVQGRHAHRFEEGSTMVVLADDVAKVFPDSKAVNDALRLLIHAASESLPQKQS